MVDRRDEHADPTGTPVMMRPALTRSGRAISSATRIGVVGGGVVPRMQIAASDRRRASVAAVSVGATGKP